MEDFRHSAAIGHSGQWADLGQGDDRTRPGKLCKMPCLITSSPTFQQRGRDNNSARHATFETPLARAHDKYGVCPVHMYKGLAEMTTVDVGKRALKT